MQVLAIYEGEPHEDRPRNSRHPHRNPRPRSVVATPGRYVVEGRMSLVIASLVGLVGGVTFLALGLSSRDYFVCAAVSLFAYCCGRFNGEHYP
jgi:hypothetical protein